MTLTAADGYRSPLKILPLPRQSGSCGNVGALSRPRK